MASDKSLAERLNVKTGHRIATINQPEEVRLDGLPEGAALVERQAGVDAIYLFARHAEDINANMAAIDAELKPQGMLWVMYPKGGAKVGTTLNRDIVWQVIEPHGWRPVRQIAVSELWSALRFKRISEG
jgi:hypothetical protein